MTNEQKAREIVGEYYNIPQKEDTESFDDIVDSVPKSLMRDIIQALSEKDAQIKEMREALEFYAEPDNWQYGFFARSKSTPPIIEQDVEHETSVPGKRAREALAKLKEQV